jgi:hypothetical protein
MENMTYTTNVPMTPAMKASARRIGETMIAMGKGKATADDLRAAMRESRAQHGDDLHEIVKCAGMAGATGGRA